MNQNTKQIIKSKHRVRDHGEVFTPNFIVQDMLNLIDHETKRIESRFLEPACGDGNFLVEVLQRKMEIVAKKYKKHQHDFERYTLLAVGSVYGIDLLQDNVHEAQQRLSKIVQIIYSHYFKKTQNEQFFLCVDHILKKNIIQGNALNLHDAQEKPLVFSERSLINGSKIKRRDFIFDELIRNEGRNTTAENTLFGDHGKPAFIPEPVHNYPPVYFLDISTLDE